MAGSWSARRLVLRLTPAHHALLLDALMLASGLSMLWAAWHA
jgi:uncharacterized membrane protein YfcA